MSLKIAFIIINCIVKNTSEIQGTTIFINATMERKLASATHHELRKKLRRSSPISYYSNTSATHLILLEGDIKTNPGPTSTTNSGLTPTNNKQNNKKAAMKHKAPICSICEKNVCINSKQMICTYCKLLTHLHCTNTKTITISNTKNMKDWICFSCASIELPFHKLKDGLSSHIKSDVNYMNKHLEKPNDLKKHIKYLYPKYPINVIYI